mgnify:FL=1
MLGKVAGRSNLYDLLDLLSMQSVQAHKAELKPYNMRATERAEEVAVVDRNEYIVDNLLSHRKRSGRNRASKRLIDLEFLVHWEGFEDAENTWEPYEGIKHLDAFKSYAQLALRGWT